MAPTGTLSVPTDAANAEPLAPEAATVDVATTETVSAAGAPSRSLLPGPEFVAPEAAPLVQEPIPVAAVEAAPPAADDAAMPEGIIVDAAASAPTGLTESKPSGEQAFIEIWRPRGRPVRLPHRPPPSKRLSPTPS